MHFGSYIFLPEEAYFHVKGRFFFPGDHAAVGS